MPDCMKLGCAASRCRPPPAGQDCRAGALSEVGDTLPCMEVVAKNSGSDIARQRAWAEVRWAAREMAANLIRVVRGAGKPHEIGLHAQDFLDAYVRYREVTGAFPSPDDLAAALSINPDPKMLTQARSDEFSRMGAEHRVVRGALQVAASRLMGQRTQESAGDDEMHLGIRDTTAIRDAEHLARVKAISEQRGNDRSRSRRSKTKAPGK